MSKRHNFINVNCDNFDAPYILIFILSKSSQLGYYSVLKMSFLIY